MVTSAVQMEQQVGPVVVSRSNKKIWAGRGLSGLSAAFLTLDAVMKLVMVPEVIEGSTKLGYPVSSIRGMGITLLASVVLYVVPRTSVLGAILLTGYLGGAVATHVRVGDPLLTHTLFPIYFGVMIWGGLFLRDERVRALLPLRK